MENFLLLTPLTEAMQFHIMWAGINASNDNESNDNASNDNASNDNTSNDNASNDFQQRLSYNLHSNEAAV